MLRRVQPEDIAVFFAQQDDERATDMAAFPARSREDHEAHWAKLLANESNIARTVVEDGSVVGNIGSFLIDGERMVSYWIGREFWGFGYASKALSDFVSDVVTERPLFADVAEHNGGSMRVLERAGFTRTGERVADDGITEVIYELR